jgi:molecular chaperone DnaJ
MQIDTIDGSESLRIPPGTQPTQVFRLRSKGVQFLQGSGRGDHYVHVSVRIPTSLNESQRDLLQRYAEAEGETPLEDKGVFGKVKDFFTNP